MKRLAHVGAKPATTLGLMIALTIGVVQGPAANGQEMPVPVDVQTALLPKILSFERTQRGRTDLSVGILYQAQVRTSLVCANQVAELLPRSLRTGGGSPIHCVMIDVSSESDLPQRLAEEGVNLVYVTPMRSMDIGDLGRLLQARRLLSFTGVPSYVDAGVALGVDARENRPVILVNLTATRATGVEFSSQLLKLARIVE
jgi:hypothetical protein